ncbi:MAG: hypothetical protein GF350_13760 [Chitinivibrionales bacterium]|nr:hypothetical protein [Chitinivibrionales bacterium]
MPGLISFFKALLFLFLPACIACRNPSGVSPGSNEFVFSVLDVGQGLAQVGVVNGKAIAWDTGPESGFAGFVDGYGRLGSPSLGSIVISHSDSDHRGGLKELPLSIVFSGEIIVSPYEDTALIRSNSGVWKEKIMFRTMARGDTLGGLDGVLVECIWPPGSLQCTSPFIQSGLKNTYSLCFMLQHGNSRCIITSDIDTSATTWLGIHDGYSLSADICVVPHHGSRSAADPVFYGYVGPQRVIVSCKKPPNNYGHPAPEILDLLFRINAVIMRTYDAGHVTARSNGEYWQWE